jgi:hypothetical protein
MLGERSTQAARNALADIQDKHKDIGDARVYVCVCVVGGGDGCGCPG